MKKLVLLLPLFLITITATFSQTYVPDDNFEQALIDLGYDDVLDDYVVTANINDIETLSVSYKNISDLTGIEDFINLTILNFGDNDITNVDISKNVNLVTLYCADNNLTSIDVTQNIKLKAFLSANNPFESSPDLSQCPLLEQMWISNCSLTEIDVTQNLNLIEFHVTHNSITYLDVSKNQELVILEISNNNLKKVNLKNENNSNITSFYSTDNPDLHCIDVDDQNWSAQNWTNIDPQTSFSEDCNDYQLVSCDIDADGLSIFDLTSLDSEIIDSQTGVSLTYHESDQDVIDNSNAISNSNAYENNNNPQTVYARLETIDTGTYETFLINLSTFSLPTVPPNFEMCDDDFDGFTNFDLSLISTDININSLPISISYFSSMTDAENEENQLPNSYTNQVPNTQTIYVRTQGNVDSGCYEISSTELIAKICPAETYVPDNNFEQELIDLGYDDVLDNYVVTDNINIITNLYVDDKGISSLIGIEDFSALRKLYCNDNNLEELDITQNTNLTVLECNNNQLSNLDITQNTSLGSLNCSNNQLSALDISQINLFILDCSQNEITSIIGTTQNTNLIEFYCGNNQLSTIDITQSSWLESFSCNDNLAISSLDVTQNGSLNKLDISNCSVSNIDITQNTLLDNLDLSGNQLSTIDITQNTVLTYLNLQSNNLSTLDLSKTNDILTLNISENQINTIDVRHIYNVKSFDCSGNNISELDLQFNHDLTSLVCISNNLTELDLSQNWNLMELYLSLNEIVSLDLSNNSALVFVGCRDNSLRTLNVKNGNNTAITTFVAAGNPELNCIQVDNESWSTANWNILEDNPSFSENCIDFYIEVCDNDSDGIAIFDLTSLDSEIIGTQTGVTLTYYESIIDATEDSSPITNSNTYESLNNPQVIYARLENNSSGTFETYSINLSSILLPVLTNTLETCDDNSMGGFEIFDLTQITEELVDFDSTDIFYSTLIDAQNETNAIANPTAFTNTSPNYQTIYVRVDIEGCSKIYPVALIVLDCTLQTFIPDDNFEQALIDLGYDDVLDDYVFTINIASIETLSISNKNISDLTGIEDFVDLKSFTCANNQLTNIDLSQNIELTIINLNHNQLENLDVSNNIALTNLDCSYNQISNLDISQNTGITVLYCQNNTLSSLTFSSTNLSEIICSNNQLTLLDLSNCFNLGTVDCSFNQIINLDLSNSSELIELQVNDNQLENLNIKNDSFHLYYGGFEIFQSNNNPSLYCIIVDYVDVAIENWSDFVDPQTSFSLDCLDDDGDGIPDNIEDINGNGDLTDDDTDGDGIPDYLDEDDDGDGVDTIDELDNGISPIGRSSSGTTLNYTDTDNDGIPNYLDDDDDGDGVLSIDEDYNNNGTILDDDINNNGIVDYLDNTAALAVDKFTAFEFSLYPNPTQNTISIAIELKGDYEIFNTNGQTIKKGKLDYGTNTVDLSSISNGLYFIEIITEKGIVIKKLIKK